MTIPTPDLRDVFLQGEETTNLQLTTIRQLAQYRPVKAPNDLGTPPNPSSIPNSQLRKVMMLSIPTLRPIYASK